MLMVHITYISFQLANSLTSTCHLLFTRGIIISVVFFSPMENWRHESSCHFLKGINSKQQNWYYKLLSWHLNILTPKPKHQTDEHKSLNPHKILVDVTVMQRKDKAKLIPVIQFASFMVNCLAHYVLDTLLIFPTVDHLPLIKRLSFFG